jgi:pheromone shutdown protein TraB
MKAGENRAAGLVLIGTVHHDPRGYDRLLRVLPDVQPDIVTLELSPYGRGFRAKHSGKLSRRIQSLAQTLQGSEYSTAGLLPAAVQQLLSAVTLPFEYCAARDYARASNIPLYCIDLSHISRRRLLMLKDEGLTRRNIAVLLKLPDKNLQNSVNLCYKRAAAAWHAQGDRHRPGAAVDQADIERDAHMSRRLRNLHARFPCKRIAHIAGWEHCADSAGAPTLYGLLRDLRPQRILLFEG